MSYKQDTLIGLRESYNNLNTLLLKNLVAI